MTIYYITNIKINFELGTELSEQKSTMKAKWIFLIVVGVIAVIAVLMFGLPMYNVWQQEMSGRAEMAKAEQNRQILVKEAEAKLQAEKLNALAEIERAKGMAQAMEIENGKLTPVYNQYLFIRTLEKISDKGSLPQTIYIPTEGLLPVMNVANKTSGHSVPTN